MTEEEARAWIAGSFGDGGLAKMEALAALVTDEAAKQNLISASTLPQLWVRHIVDSAQLISLAGMEKGVWVDIGSGAGFPGLVVASLTQFEVVLVEPRKRRAEFLQQAADALGLANVSVIASKIEAVSLTAHVISARAVASVNALFNAAIGLARSQTVWLLPKGRGAREELAHAQLTWHGVFHVEHSITDPSSLIVVARKVRQ